LFDETSVVNIISQIFGCITKIGVTILLSFISIIGKPFICPNRVIGQIASNAL